MPMTLENILYTTHATSTGGRNGESTIHNAANTHFQLAKPKELGGNDQGVNPEQLFAVGYSACFLGALHFVASQKKAELPTTTKVTATVNFGKRVPSGFGLSIILTIESDFADKALLKSLVETAHNDICPYSHVTRNNVEVTLVVK